MRRSSPGQRTLLHREVGVEVDLRRLDALMAEPKRNDGSINAGLEQVHGRGMAQYVRGDVLAREARTGPRGGLGMLVHESLDGITTEPGAALAGEDRIFRRAAEEREPGAERGGRLAGDGCNALLAAFTGAAEVCARTEDAVVDSQGGQLRDAEAGLDSDEKEEVVASPDPCGAVRRSEKCFDLRVSEEGHELPVEAFLRDGQDALDQCGMGGLAGGCEAEERTDGGESGIAGPCAVATAVFEVVEESSDE